jgi:hypothetical protein
VRAPLRVALEERSAISLHGHSPVLPNPPRVARASRLLPGCSAVGPNASAVGERMASTFTLGVDRAYFARGCIKGAPTGVVDPVSGRSSGGTPGALMQSCNLWTEHAALHESVRGRRDRRVTDAIGSLRPSPTRGRRGGLTQLPSRPLPERNRRRSMCRGSRPLSGVQ